MSWASSRSRFLCALLALMAACGDDDSDNFVGTTHDNKRDSGPSADSGRTEPKPADHMLFSDDQYLCGYDDEDVVELLHASRGQLAIATDDRGFGLIHDGDEGGLVIEGFPIAGERQEAVSIAAAADEPAGAVIAAVEQRFLLGYRSGSTLFVRLLEGDRQAVSLTDRLATPEGGGNGFALIALESGFGAAWIEPAEGDATRVMVQGVDTAGQALGVPQEIAALADRTPLHLQLAKLDFGRVLLAWSELDDDGFGRIETLALDDTLAAVRSPVQLSKARVNAPRFELAARKLSAGVVYHALEGGVRESLKYRRVDDAGDATEAELNLVNAPHGARDGSITDFGQGYAVAYRVLPSLGVDVPALRVAFINQFGRVVHEVELDETTADGGPTSIRASADGHVLVAYSSELPSGRVTRAVAMDCPGALVLCGGALD